jgi:hypothetical protein
VGLSHWLKTVRSDHGLPPLDLREAYGRDLGSEADRLAARSFGLARLDLIWIVERRSKGRKGNRKGKAHRGLPTARTCGSGMDADVSPVIVGGRGMVDEGRGIVMGLPEPSPSSICFCSVDGSRSERSGAPASFGHP